MTVLGVRGIFHHLPFRRSSASSCSASTLDLIGKGDFANEDISSSPSSTTSTSGSAISPRPEISERSSPSGAKVATILGLLEELKGTFCAEAKADSRHDEDAVGQQLLLRLLSAEVPLALVRSIPCLDFEKQKSAMRSFSQIFRLASGLSNAEVLDEHFGQRPEIFHGLLHGCGTASLLTTCANMLRECTRRPSIVRLMLENKVANELVRLARHGDCDVSFESFESLRKLLLTHPSVTASHLLGSASACEEFFVEFHRLIETDESGYVMQRQALKLLDDLLHHSAFRKVVRAYAARVEFLQIHMNLLRNASATIRLGAFQIFKAFVTNPEKPSAVAKILARNRDRLVIVLQAIASSHGGSALVSSDELHSDIQDVITQVVSLPAPPRKI